MLHLIEGPAGGGKSQLAADMLAAGTADLIADTTELWAAIGGYARDPQTGRYPVRRDDDPALTAAQYTQIAVVRHGLREGLNVIATTSRRGQVDRWRRIADEAETALDVTTVDPGVDVVRSRLADPVTGELSADCENALARWY